MTKIRTIIADDEFPARNELAFLLGKISDIDLIAQAKNGLEALKIINEEKPDLIFLDIQMPGKTGLDIAREIKGADINPLIVFVTAYDSYAVEAFEVNAVDYLLKPYEENRLMELMKRVNRNINTNKMMEEKLEYLLDKLETISETNKDIGVGRLAVESKRGHIKLLKYDEIILIYTKNSKIYARTSAEEYEVTSTLCMLEKKLKGHQFLRIHRSYIINLNKVKEIIPWFKGNYQIVMNDNKETELIVSRSKVKTLQEIFDL